MPTEAEKDAFIQSLPDFVTRVNNRTISEPDAIAFVKQARMLSASTEEAIPSALESFVSCNRSLC